MVKRPLNLALLAVALTALLSPAAARAQKLTVQGRISRADGTPVNGAATKFRVQVLSNDPAKHCVLYDETHTEDMSDSKGLFSVNLGEVNPSRISRDPPTNFSLAQVFANRGSLSISGGYCSPILGGTVTIPFAAGDNRKMIIQFNDPSSMGSTWEKIPEMDINFVAYAMDAQAVSGFDANSLVRVVDGNGDPQSFNALTSGEATELGNLVAGTSNRYVGKGGSAGVQLPSGAPVSPGAGSVWFESGNLKFSDGVNPPHTIGTSGGGTITGVTASTGLTGGGTSGNVSLALSPSGVGAGATKGSATMVPQITYDTHGRITGVMEVAISGTVPTAGSAGEVLKSNGSAWTSAPLRMGDIRSSSDEGTVFPTLMCSASETMFWNSGTDKFECQGIVMPDLSPAVGGTYRRVVVNSKGLVTAGDNPTTLGDYGITDALKNTNGVTNFVAGNTVGRGPAGNPGKLYVDTQALTLYRDNGSTWDVIGSAGAGGSLTGVTAGAGLTGGGSAGNVTVAMDTAGITAGNYYKVTTDAYGRVLSGNNALVAADIPSLDWTKITGTPTTLADYGIVKNYVENSGAALSLSAGNTAGKGAFGTAGRIYIDTQANTVSYDTGSAWQTIAAGGGFTGSLGGEVSGTQGATQVDSINGITRSTITTNLNAVSAATDAATNSAIVKRDSSGGFSAKEVRLQDGTTNTVALKAAGTSAAYSLQLPAAAPTAGQSLQSDGSGVLSWVTAAAGSLTNILQGTGISVTGSGATRTVTLADTAVTPNSYGSATKVPSFTVDQQGRLTAAADITITGTVPGGSAGGDLSGTYPNPSVAKIQTVGVSSTAPGLGQVLKYVSSNWAASTLDLNDLKQNDNTTSAMANASSLDCTASKVMYYDTSTKSLRCQNASIAAATQITGILPIANGGTGANSVNAKEVFVGPASGTGTPSFRTLTASDLPASASFWETATGGINYAGGKVGVGVTAPGANLHVKSSGTSNYVMRAGASSGSSLFGAVESSSSTMYLRLDDASSQTVQIHSDGVSYFNGGNVGIGTSAPGYPLHVNGGSLPVVVSNTDFNTGTSAGSALVVSPVATSGNTTYKINAVINGGANGGNLSLQPTGGNVGIGTTGPGSALDVKGTLRLSGSTSGYVGFAPAAAAGSTTYTLPNADGTSGYVLSTNGSGALSWIANTAGSVTSVTAGTGLTGGGTGSVSIGLGTELAGLNGLSTTGFVKRTGAGTYTAGQASLTADVSGVLPLANGGTNANLTAVNGGVAYSTASAMAFTAAGSAGQILRSAGAAAPTWSTATFPSTATSGDLLYASSANTWSSLAKANTAALVTSSAGVPSWASGTTANRLLRTDGTSVSFSQASLTTDVSGVLPITNGGTGASSVNAKEVFMGPTSGTGAPSFRTLTASDLPASASYWTAATGGISYASGNVGIGTTTPEAPLTIQKTSAGAETIALHLLNKSSTASAGVTIDLDPSSAGVATRSSQIGSIASPSAHSTNLVFRTSYGNPPTEKMRIDYAGNVGIATASPRERLDLGGIAFHHGGSLGIQFNQYWSVSNSRNEFSGYSSPGYAGGIGFDVTGGNMNFSMSPSSGAAGAASGNVNRMSITAAGNVGIGTSSPNQKLSVAGTIETTSGGVKFPDGSVQTKASQVLNTYFVTTGTSMQTINSTTPVVVTGLSVTLTPASTNSRFIINAVVNGSLTYVASTLVYRNGSSILSQANNNAAGAMATTFANDASATTTTYMRQHHVNYVDSPNTTASITYDIRHVSAWGGTAYTTYVNDRSGGDMRTPSTLMITELSN